MSYEPKYHPELEQLVDLFVAQTNNPCQHFFRVQIAFFLGAVAANMRAYVKGWTGNRIPINVYAINLSPSGAGKGFSTRGLNRDVLQMFYEVFNESTMPISSMANLSHLANKRAAINSSDVSDELLKLEKEYALIGAFFPTFDSASIPAIKQLRHKVQLANCGSINIMMDEIGTNLLGNAEALAIFLELYDMGDAQEKLIKSSAENMRTQRISTPTPANMLLFGEPTSLLDGAATEAKFFKMLATGYARRCIYGFIPTIDKVVDRSAEEMLDSMNSNSSSAIIDSLNDRFGIIADANNLNRNIEIQRPQALRLMTYKIDCEKLAAKLPDHESIRKAELEHRYFKALKIAGAYAFFDSAPMITDTHLDYALTLVEDSGEHFQRLVTPVRSYVRLAQYLAQCYPNEMTMADLDRDLPYMPAQKAAKDEMFVMAAAWGYKNNHIITRTISNGIVFYSGQTLEPTSLDRIRLSFSQDMTLNYQNRVSKFSDLDKLLSLPQVRHWINHHLQNGHRHDGDIVTGFNMLVFDIDGDCPLRVAQTVLAKYTYKMYTTKSHGIDGKDRYRIMLPINYVLHLKTDEYKELMASVAKELPLIKMEEEANHRCKKWLTNPSCTIYTNETEMLFDILPFIPNTAKAEERERVFNEQSNLDAVERWVINTSDEGNRNNTLFRYAMILTDMNLPLEQTVDKLKDLNSKLLTPLDEAELTRTVIATITQRYTLNTK